MRSSGPEPKHCGTHSMHLLGRAVAGDAGGGEARAEDRQADAGVAPEQLLERDRQREAGGVAPSTPGRRSRRSRGRSWPPPATIGHGNSSRSSHSWAAGPHHGGGEVVDPLLDLLLVVVQRQREARVMARSYRSVIGRQRSPMCDRVTDQWSTVLRPGRPRGSRHGRCPNVAELKSEAGEEVDSRHNEP